MHRKNKRGDIKMIVTIAILIILFLVLVVMVNEAGGFSNKIITNLKEKLNPFS